MTSEQKGVDVQDGQCSPGDPAPPPSTPAQHYLAEINGCASQEWQDGYNAAVRRLMLPQPKPRPRLGRCNNLKQAGGCPLHNLQCGYPKCDESPTEAQP